MTPTTKTLRAVFPRKTYTYTVPYAYQTYRGAVHARAALKDRNRAIVQAYQDGMGSTGQIGAAFGMTGQNVHHILKASLGKITDKPWRAHTAAHVVAVAESSPTLTAALARLRIAHYRLRGILTREGRTDILERWNNAAREGRTRWTRERAYAALVDWMVAHDGATPTKDDYRTGNRLHVPHPNTITRLFGSWRAYLTGAPHVFK